MKGTVLDFSIQSNEGIISGDDGTRYKFGGSQWKPSRMPSSNIRVDFEVMQGKAEEVYLDVGSNSSPLSKIDKFMLGDENSAIRNAISASSTSQTNSRLGANRVVAGIVALFFGGLGIHKFYMGYSKEGVIMLGIWLVGLLFGGIPSVIIVIIAFIESITYLVSSDEKFHDIYIANRKSWF